VFNQNNSNLSFYEPSDLLENYPKGKPAHLLFYRETVQFANTNYTALTNTDPHYSKALLSKVDYENGQIIFAFRPHDVI
jgi:hypothetical protein